MRLDVVDQVFKYMGNYFFLGALITLLIALRHDWY